MPRVTSTKEKQRNTPHKKVMDYTKNAQVVTNLQQTCSNAVPTTCQQDVFALLVPSLLTSCQRLVDNLLQGWWAQQTCYKLQQLVIVLQFSNLSTSCEWQPCSNLMKQQHCYNLLISLLQACCEHILLTSLLLSSTDLLQVVPTTCYRPAIQQFVNKLWATTL